VPKPHAEGETARLEARIPVQVYDQMQRAARLSKPRPSVPKMRHFAAKICCAPKMPDLRSRLRRRIVQPRGSCVLCRKCWE